MSTSEIVAWQLGADIVTEVEQGDPLAKVPARLDWPHLTTDQARARFNLGDKTFASWVVLGALDARAERRR